MTNKRKNDDDLTRTMKVVGGVGALTTGVAFAGFGLHEGASVAVGAFIAVSNLWVLGKIVSSVLPDEESAPKGVGEAAASETEKETNAKTTSDDGASPAPSGGLRAAWTAFALVKILILFGGVWFLMSKGLVSPMGLVVGYGALPIGIALSTMLGSMRPR